MNPYEVDVMKLTPEDYLKMRDRCRELEDKKKQQADYIFELKTELERLRVAMKESEEKIKARFEHTNSELSATINRMHGGCERAIEFRRLVDTLFDVGRDEVVSDEEILRRMKNLRDEMDRLKKENVLLYQQRNSLRNDKKQQADCILKLETELSQFRVAMKESEEKIKALNDSIDQLNKELADESKEAKYWAYEAHWAQKLISEMIYNGESNASETALKDADAKIQSANDRAANAKKEAKEAKERAESASEMVRYLERKLRDVESLNDSLMKELSRRQGCQAEIREHDTDIYQLDVLKYAPDYQHYKLNVLYAAIGMCGEAGEVAELVKKYEYHGHAIDTEHLARELGDVLWYVAYMADLFGYPLGKIMAMNQEKLAKRYPDGKFDAERSRNREAGDI